MGNRGTGHPGWLSGPGCASSAGRVDRRPRHLGLVEHMDRRHQVRPVGEQRPGNVQFVRPALRPEEHRAAAAATRGAFGARARRVPVQRAGVVGDRHPVGDESGPGHEGGAMRAPAVGAMAVRNPPGRQRRGKAHGAAQAGTLGRRDRHRGPAETAQAVRSQGCRPRARWQGAATRLRWVHGRCKRSTGFILSSDWKADNASTGYRARRGPRAGVRSWEGQGLSVGRHAFGGGLPCAGLTWPAQVDRVDRGVGSIGASGSRPCFFVSRAR